MTTTSSQSTLNASSIHSGIGTPLLNVSTTNAYAPVFNSKLISEVKSQSVSIFQDLADSQVKTKTDYRTITTQGTESTVSAPNAAFNFVPFDIKRRGSNVYPDTNFDLETHANISGTTVYVSQSTGSDSNDGSSGSPFATLLQAMGSGASVIYISDGYFYKSQRSNSCPNSCKIIATGDDVWFTSDQANLICNGSGWSKSGNTWTKTGVTDFFSRMYDSSQLDDFGQPTYYDIESSSAAVDANSGSFWLDWGNNTLYINTLDGLEPSTDLRLIDSICFAPSQNNTTYYFKNINFTGNARVRNSTSTGGMKFYAEDCSFYTANIHGVTESILFNCTSNYTYDGDRMNYDSRNTLVTNAIEWNCVFNGTITDTSGQCSTGHNACNIVRIGSYYSYNSGQNVADVTGCKTWMLGCNTFSSDTEVGFYMDGDAWLDSCNSSDNTTDIQTISGTTVYVYNQTRDGSLGYVGLGDGTITSYTPS